MPNYQQPDFRNPVTPGVSVQVEATAAGNPLQVTSPVAKYSQPGQSAPSAPVAGQLDNTPLGRSKVVHADGTSSST
jgi:hypothetical protein